MIEVENLTKKYNGVKAVDNISFNIEKGEIVGFLGPNGAGKTTTLRVITGYFPPTTGKCRIAGFDIEEEPINTKSKIGYLPENNPLYYEMKVIEYLDFVADIRNIAEKTNRIKEVIEICGIKNVISKNIGELSKGYKQRVGLAQAIIHNPDILIMDEPTEGLDPIQIAEVRELIKELGKEKTVLLSTHRLAEVELTCERVIIINKGKIVADAKKDELYKLAKGKEIIELEIKSPSEKALSVLKELPNIESITFQEGKYEIEAKPGEDPREAIFRKCVENNFVIIDMHRRIASLESVFKELTQE